MSGAVAIVAIAISAYQILQAAEIQRQGSELERRLMLAQLAFDAHNTAFEFLGTFADDLARREEMKPEEIKETDLKEAVRIAGVKLFGAISRASVIDDELIVLCLHDMQTMFLRIANNNIAGAVPLDGEQVMNALDRFPQLINAYVSQTPYDAAWVAKVADNGLSCPFYSDVILDGNASQDAQ